MHGQQEVFFGFNAKIRKACSVAGTAKVIEARLSDSDQVLQVGRSQLMKSFKCEKQDFVVNSLRDR